MSTGAATDEVVPAGPTLGDAPAARAAGSARHRGLRLTGWYTLLTVLAVVVLFPVYTTVAGALRRNGEGKLKITRCCGPKSANSIS